MSLAFAVSVTNLFCPSVFTPVLSWGQCVVTLVSICFVVGCDCPGMKESRRHLCWVQKSPKTSKESLLLLDTQVPRSTSARASSSALPSSRLSGCKLVSCTFDCLAHSGTSGLPCLPFFLACFLPVCLVSSASPLGQCWQ